MVQELLLPLDMPGISRQIILLCTYALLSSAVQLSAQNTDFSALSNKQLITFIQKHSIEEAYPHLKEVILRITENDELNEEMRGLLSLSYFELSRYHYLKFIEKRNSGDASSSIEFGQELRKLTPEGGNSSLTLQFEIHIHELQQDWEAMRAALSFGLEQIKQKVYPSNLKFEWLESICYSYAAERQWEEGLPYFIDANTAALSPTKLKTLSSIYLIQAYETLEEPEKALPHLPSLQASGEERYDPNLNFSLFKLGNQLSDKDAYSSANYMYFLCLTLEDILVHKERQLNNLYAYKRTKEQRNIKLTEQEIRRIEQLEKYVAELANQTSYTGPLKYQRAQNLERMSRKFDAYFAYLRLINEHPEHSSAQLFHYTAFNQADEINYYEDALDLGERYLANEEYKTYRKEVVVKLVAQYFELERYERIYELGQAFIAEYPEHDYGNNIAHFMGFAWMRENKIAEAKRVLGGYLEKHPDAPLAQAANYWVGLGHVIEQDFEAAAKNFDQVIQKFPEGNFYVESRFRRTVCEFGLGDYESAEDMFSSWVNDYPSHTLRGEAEVFLGDIDAYYANVEPALKHYSSVETYTQKMNLVDHAYFESVRLLDTNERYQDMIDLLERYMDKYQEVGNLTQAILRIGQAYESLGKPEVMIQAYYEAIVEYGNNAKAEGVDEIIVKFAQRYETFITYYDNTIAFLEKLLRDESFRLQMIDDRKALHVYRLKNQKVDSDIIDSLLRNQELRNGLGTREPPRTEKEIAAEAPIKYETHMLPEAKAVVEAHLQDFKDRLARLPQRTPAEQLKELYETAKSTQQRTLELRLLAAFGKLSVHDAPDTKIVIQDLPYASPATLAWIGASELENDPGLAELAIEHVLVDYADSMAAPSAYYTKSKILQRDGDLAGAIELLDFIRNSFPTWPKAPEVTLKAASLAMENVAYEDATERYLEVLQIRDWRGAAWAEACFQIGQCYEITGERLKAHGFYERTYLTYRQFPEWAAKAYYHDGLLLEKMNEIQSAKQVYQAYMQLPEAESLPNYEAVRTRHEAL